MTLARDVGDKYFAAAATAPARADARGVGVYRAARHVGLHDAVHCARARARVVE